MTIHGVRDVASGERFAERRADALKPGNGVLTKYYDWDGSYREEVWTVQGVKVRRYGKGARVYVTWEAGLTTDWFAPDKPHAVSVS